MANEQNLVSFKDLTAKKQREIARQGGIASGKVRKEKATMKRTLEMLLDEKSSKGKTYRELSTLGLIKGAVQGKAENYKMILQLLGELKEVETITEANRITIVNSLGDKDDS